MKKLFLLLILLFATATLVNAVQSTQQSNKIFLSPFYRQNLVSNTNYTYNLTINPDDGISRVSSAIISFNLQANGQTQAYTLWVNGKSCNNPTYSIATAFSTTGQLQFYFDCSNVITSAGNYTVTLRSDTNTGAVSGWIDLTYMNNPVRDLVVGGTEYVAGDNGTTFVQVTSDLTYISETVCQMQMFYPNKTIMVSTSMTQLPANTALFYYDFTVPSYTGVYMMSSTCTAPIFRVPVLPMYFGQTSSIQTLVNSTFTGAAYSYAMGTLATGVRTCSVVDWTYEPSQFLGGLPMRRLNGITNVSVNLNAALTRTTTIEVVFYVLNLDTATVASFASVTGSGSVTSTTTKFTLSNVTLQTPIPFTSNERLVAEVCLTNQGASTTYNFVYGNNTYNSGFVTDVNGVNTTQVVEYHGAGEVHVSKLYDQLSAQYNSSATNINNIPASVWNYTNRNLTYYNMTDTTNYTRIDNTIYAINTSINTNIDNTRINLTTRINQLEATMIAYFNNISLNVWNYATRTLTALGFDNTNYTRITTEVWNATNRNLTYYNMTDTTNYSRISNLTALDVWTYTTRNLTYYQNFSTPQIDMTNYTLITQNVWTYVTRTLTASPENVTAIANAVWTSNTRNLTYYPVQTDMTNYSLIGLYVWNTTTRNLTYYQNFTEPQVDMTNYTLINSGVSAAVWVYVNRNLTYYENFTEPQVDMTNYSRISNLTASDVWTYPDRNLTYYAPAFVNNTEVAIAVWNATTRNLTYYPAQVDLTNYSAINEGVWTYIDRNLTYFPPQVDLTNYSAIESGVWAYNNRSLTFYPTQADLTNYTLINEGVWTYTDRNLTYYPTVSNLTASDVWTYATRDLTYYQVNNISAVDVWTYINRTLTYYEVNNISATDVWAYNNRTLTYYPSQQDLTNYTAIWTYPDRNLTYYAPAIVNNTAVAEETWNYSARYTHGELITG